MPGPSGILGPSPSLPAAGRIVARIPLHAQVLGPLTLAAGEGSVWVTLGGSVTGLMERIGTSSGRAVGQTVVGWAADHVTVGRGAVWVSNGIGDGSEPRSPHQNSVSRVDPVTGRVTATAAVTMPGLITAGASAVWVVSANQTLVRLDPRSARQTAHISLPTISSSGVNPAAALAILGGEVWVAIPNASSASSTLVAVDSVRNTVAAIHQAPGIVGALFQVHDGLLAVAQDRPDAVSLERVDPATGATSILGALPEPPVPGGVALAPSGSGWILSRNGTVYSFDPATGARTSEDVTVPDGGGSAFVATDHAVWVLCSTALDEIAF